MDVQLSIRSAHASDDLISLANRLRAERRLQGSVRQQRAPIAEGNLGGAFELISVAIGSGRVATALAGTLATWLQNRPRTTVKITRGDLSVEVDSGKIKDINELIEKILEGDDQEQ